MTDEIAEQLKKIWAIVNTTEEGDGITFGGLMAARAQIDPALMKAKGIELWVSSRLSANSGETNPILHT